MMATAKEQEAQMTSDVLAALPGGARMHGLAFRMKSPESLARKLNDRIKKSPMRDPEQIADGITDVVRYTAISDPNQVVATARTMASQLAERGWTVIEVEQSYIDGNQYKGLHMLARHSSGRVAEFHSTPRHRSGSRTPPTSTTKPPAIPGSRTTNGLRWPTR